LELAHIGKSRITVGIRFTCASLVRNGRIHFPGGYMISRTLVSIVSAVTLASALSACGTPSRQTMGTVGGAALGGLAGHSVTGGSTAGTVGGAAVGGVIGHEVTK
jgi:osmotically inducible lipoprotein OsmB